MLEELLSNPLKGINSLLIIKDKETLFENYYDGYTCETDSDVFSATKSFVSTLIGIAIDKGIIKSLDEKIIEFFPHLLSSAEWYKRDLTIRHFITMTSGIFFPPTHGMSRRMSKSGNEAEFILQLPVRKNLINKFAYNDGNYHVLSAILTKATGMSTYDFASKHLFEPLGITRENSDYPFWLSDSNNICYGGFGLKLTARDMSKIGILFNQNGLWNNEYIVSNKWIDEARKYQVKVQNNKYDYGYGWWIMKERGYLINIALGGGSQYIICIPEIMVVIVIQSHGKSIYLDIDEFIEKIICHFIDEREGQI